MSREILVRACELHGQRGVARLISKSPTTVNQILRGFYPNPQRILAIVAQKFGDLESGEWACPILGVIHPDVCERYRTWAEAGVVHKDRLYMQVKSVCKTCERSF